MSKPCSLGPSIVPQGEAKERFNEIQQELSQLSTKFSNNVLDATKVRRAPPWGQHPCCCCLPSHGWLPCACCLADMCMCSSGPASCKHSMASTARLTARACLPAPQQPQAYKKLLTDKADVEGLPESGGRSLHLACIGVECTHGSCRQLPPPAFSATAG